MLAVEYGLGRTHGGQPMKKIFVAGIAAAAFCGAPVFAADMPVKAAPFAPVVNWTGCYMGGNLGGGWKHVRANYDTGEPIMDHTFDGFVGGGQIGCDYQVDNKWVIGIQGMLDGSDVKGTVVDSTINVNPINVKANWFGTVAAELGYLINPSLKFYGKAGYGWLREKQIYNCSATGCLGFVASLPFSETRSGFDAGLGLTWMFQPNWDVFVEYDHMWLGTKTENFPSPILQVNARERFDKILVGIDYRFGGPVLAKY
jgi:outer membrane immunogenic protein